MRRTQSRFAAFAPRKENAERPVPAAAPAPDQAKHTPSVVNGSAAAAAVQASVKSLFRAGSKFRKSSQ